MPITASLIRKRATALTILSAWLLMATVGVGGLFPATAWAQTGGPPQTNLEPVISPPAGAATVDALVQTVAPAGVPALIGPGVIALVPTATSPGTLSTVTADLGGGARLTLLLPADQTSRYVRLQAVVAGVGSPPAGLDLAQTAIGFSIDLYDVNTKAPLRDMPQPATAGVRVPNQVDPQLLLAARFEEATSTVQFVPAIADPATRIVQFTVPTPDQYFLGVAATGWTSP